MKYKLLFGIFLISAIVATGCSGKDPYQQTEGDNSKTEDAAVDQTQTFPLETVDASGIFSDRDFEEGYDESKSATIRLNGSSASCSSDAVRISGSTVTILDEGTYILTGTLDNGMIIVNSEKTDKTHLVLNGINIHSETCAPVYILQSDKVFITTAEGSTNTLSNGGAFTSIDENSIDAVIYSKEDVTLNGSGMLVITSPAGHGIVSKDSLTITGGSYDINSASHALAGKEDVCIANGEFTIVSGKDGIHAENSDDASSGFVYIRSGSFDIKAQGDGISASAHMQIEDGSFSVVSGGGSVNATTKTSDSWGGFMGGGRHGGKMDPKIPSSATKEDDGTSIKGIKAGTELIIHGGTFMIDSADDAVHSNASVTVKGGNFEIASGDDAFHAEDTLTITDGNILISKSYEGLEGLHVMVEGGDIRLTASDDGLNAAGGTDASGGGGRDAMFGGGKDAMFGKGGMSASSNGSITISGGKLYVNASGDGIDANGTLDITGGYTIVCGPTQGDTATLDYDTRATISGGTFMGTGASGMAQTFSDSKQGVISVNAGRQEAGIKIQLKDKDGKVVITHEPELSFSVAILSTPDIKKGETYTLTIGTISGEFTAK